MFEDIGEQIVGVIAIAAFSGLGGFFALLRRCLTKIEKRTLRQSEAMVSMAEDMDKTTNTLHPDANSTMSERVSRQLKDEFGNL